MVTTVVREAGEGDTASLLRILELCPEAGAWSESDFRSATRRCLVAECEGRPAGLLLAECPAPEEAEILTLAVEPAARRQGIATTLLEAFLGPRRGRVFLEVRQSNVAAQRLYRRLGFRSVGTRRDYYSSPRENALVMELVCLQ